MRQITSTYDAHNHDRRPPSHANGNLLYSRYRREFQKQVHLFRSVRHFGRIAPSAALV
jgi:hypothetical protein